jgi:hypothetical protein
MTALPITGIPVIDRELEQHEFANADEAEILAAAPGDLARAAPGVG